MATQQRNKGSAVSIDLEAQLPLDHKDDEEEGECNDGPSFYGFDPKIIAIVAAVLIVVVCGTLWMCRSGTPAESSRAADPVVAVKSAAGAVEDASEDGNDVDPNCEEKSESALSKVWGWVTDHPVASAATTVGLAAGAWFLPSMFKSQEKICQAPSKVDGHCFNGDQCILQGAAFTRAANGTCTKRGQVDKLIHQAAAKVNNVPYLGDFTKWCADNPALAAAGGAALAYKPAQWFMKWRHEKSLLNGLAKNLEFKDIQWKESPFFAGLTHEDQMKRLKQIEKLMANGKWEPTDLEDADIFKRTKDIPVDLFDCPLTPETFNDYEAIMEDELSLEGDEKTFLPKFIVKAIASLNAQNEKAVLSKWLGLKSRAQATKFWTKTDERALAKEILDFLKIIEKVWPDEVGLPMDAILDEASSSESALLWRLLESPLKKENTSVSVLNSRVLGRIKSGITAFVSGHATNKRDALLQMIAKLDSTDLTEDIVLAYLTAEETATKLDLSVDERALISECVNDVGASDAVPPFPECPKSDALTQEALLFELDRIANPSATTNKKSQARMRVRLYEFSLGLKEDEAKSLHAKALKFKKDDPEVHLNVLKHFYSKVGSGFKLAGDATDSEKRLKSVFSEPEQLMDIVVQFGRITDGTDAKRYAQTRALLNLGGNGESKTPVAVRKENQRKLIKEVHNVWFDSNGKRHKRLTFDSIYYGLRKKPIKTLKTAVKHTVTQLRAKKLKQHTGYTAYNGKCTQHKKFYAKHKSFSQKHWSGTKWEYCQANSTTK